MGKALPYLFEPFHPRLLVVFPTAARHGAGFHLCHTACARTQSSTPARVLHRLLPYDVQHAAAHVAHHEFCVWDKKWIQ